MTLNWSGTSGNSSERLREIAARTRTTKANVATALHVVSARTKQDHARVVTQHPLGDEFTRLSDYLSLMAIRMGPRMAFELDLPPTLESAPVPRFILQPLVENAIRHGLEPQVSGGRIEVQARAEGAQLLEFKTPDETVAAVQNGEADAVLADGEYLQPVVDASGGALVVVETIPLVGVIFSTEAAFTHVVLSKESSKKAEGIS